MTDEEINKAIAIYLGWQGVVSDPITGVMGLPPSINDGDHLHIRTAMWTKDLNAMHEAEKVLAPQETDKYVTTLCLEVQPEPSLHNATARQRAEAFLRALGKWEEGE
jgi:hypothetical protein